MEPHQYSYVLSVRKSSQLIEGITIRDFFDDLNLILFDTYGYYYDSNKSSEIKGTYHFCTQEELDQITLNSDWPLVSKCPFVGPIMGYCLFQPWEDDFFNYLMELTLNSGLGFIGRVKDGACFDIVAEKELTLIEVVGRLGFGEGAFTLMETDDYDKYVRETIEKSLEPLGLKPSSYHAGDHCHILDGFEDDKKNRIENWQKFESNADKIILKLWIADWGNKKIEHVLSQDG